MRQKKIIISLLLMSLTLYLVTACGTNNSVTQGTDNTENSTTPDVSNKNQDTTMPDTDRPMTGNTMETPITDDVQDPMAPDELPKDAMTDDTETKYQDNSALDDVEGAINSTTEGVTDAAKDVAGGVKETVDDLADGAKNAVDKMTK